MLKEPITSYCAFVTSLDEGGLHLENVQYFIKSISKYFSSLDN